MARAPTDIRSLARLHTEASIASLAGIATNGESESAKVAACVALLDRGWGKCAQPHTGADGESDIRITIRQILESSTAEKK